MRTWPRDDGLSLAETLIAVILIAAAIAAVLPAVAQAARLQRESELQTSATLAATAYLERLSASTRAGGAMGGSLETPIAGWHAWLDRDGRATDAAAGVFLCKWRASDSAATGVAVAAVRVEPRAAPDVAVTLSTVVRRE